MIKIRPVDTQGIWSIITPISYTDNSEIEALPDVIHFIQKNIGSGKYGIEKANPTGKIWYLIDREKVTTEVTA